MLPLPKTCRYPNCSNSLPSFSSDLFCQELHAEENDSKEVTIVPDLRTARVIIARPKYMRLWKAETDMKMWENLTGYPQLPDPSVPNTRLPADYERKLAAEEAKYAAAADNQPPPLDLQLLRKMKEAYTRARKTQEHDLTVLVRRERLNQYCREELAPSGEAASE